MGSKKPAMMDLRQWHSVNIGMLADKAHVEPSVIYSMVLGRPVQRSKAVQVFDGLSRLVGVDYAPGSVNYPFGG